MKVIFENVKVSAAGEMRSGIGSNGEWKVQPYILEDTVRQERFEVEFMNDRIAEANLQVGETVTIEAFVNAREYNGRFYYSFRGYRRVDPQHEEQQLAAQPVTPQPQAVPAPKKEGGLPF